MPTLKRRIEALEAAANADRLKPRFVVLTQGGNHPRQLARLEELRASGYPVRIIQVCLKTPPIGAGTS